MAKVSAADIAKIPNTEFSNSKRDRNIIINPNHHYELQSVGVTLDVTNNRESALLSYNQCHCTNKTLYENIGGKKCVLQQKL